MNQWHENYIGGVENYPKPFNKTALGECDLTWRDYKDLGKWSNEKIMNCKNSSTLSQKVLIKIDDLQIEFIEVQFYGSIGNPQVYYMNDTVKSDIISWKRTSHNNAEHLGWGNCFTMVIQNYHLDVQQNRVRLFKSVIYYRVAHKDPITQFLSHRL